MSAFPDAAAVAVPLLTQAARVLRVDAGYALVEVIGGGCGRCHEAGGCGSAHLTRMFCFRPRRCRVQNRIDAPAGARVTVVLPAGVLRRHVRIAYVLPLLALLGGAVLGDVAAGDAGAAAGAVFGLALAWWMARCAISGKLPDEPYIANIEFQEEKT
ncbi:MAG: SoxR reducing system RseC family protein [Zoogloeaceae bacterium]|jgi:sigma-E factor negative regulatory protein RseC|nr:SoxR reducing system RseC family protein [Zoogloeaceae bacterium]